MFLQSCGVLASESKSLVDVIEKLDRQLESAHAQQELRLEHLAYVVEAEEEVVGHLVERLVALKALVADKRWCCPDHHILFTQDELDEARDNGTSLRCSQCHKWLRGDTLTTITVFRVIEKPRYSATQASRKTKKVLFVAANPTVEFLSLDEELKQIQQKLALQKTRIEVELHFRPAATIADLRNALLTESPNVVHFSGHGKSNGLIFQNDTGEPHRVPAKGLSTLFSAFSADIDCIVLNACYSGHQAKTIAGRIRYVVGMRGTMRPTFRKCRW